MVSSLRGGRWLAPLLSAAAVAAKVAVASSAAAAADVPLIEAVKTANTATIRALLEQHVDVNSPEADGTTALHWAVHRSDLETVELLIRAGATVENENRYGVKPLLLAANNGHAAIIERLLKAGADPNTVTPGGESALMAAARNGTPEALSVLIASGAEVNVREGWLGQSALMWAAAQNNATALRVLIENGADVHARTVPVTGAGAPRSRRSDPTGRGTGFTPFLFAVRAGHFESVRTLLAAGANVNDTLSDGTSALHLAIMNAHFELAAFLLDQGADANADAPGWTPLHRLVWTRRPNSGAVNPPAVPTGKMDSLEFAGVLLAAGANPDARQSRELVDEHRNNLNRVGATPFLLAAQACDTEFTAFLHAHGADPLLPTEDLTTPLMAAAGVGIYLPGESPGTEAECLATVEQMFELGGTGADVNRARQDGYRAVHGAAHRGAGSIIEFLVDQGARLDVVTQPGAGDRSNTDGWTPLEIADGVQYSVNLQSYPETAELIRRLMREHGLPVDEETSESVATDVPQ